VQILTSLCDVKCINNTNPATIFPHKQLTTKRYTRRVEFAGNCVSVLLSVIVRQGGVTSVFTTPIIRIP
jgi:hypothetical protein